MFLNRRSGNLTGFSLAEILIVMTVIGVIATLTMPQLIGGVDEAHYKAGVKKAYTTLANIVAMEKADDNLPTSASKEAMINFFNALNNNLEVEGYALRKTSSGAQSKSDTHKAGEIHTGIKWENVQYGDSSDSVDYPSNSTDSPWIITADGMAFSVYYNSSRTCKKKSYLNTASTSQNDLANNSCLTITVDVNGLQRGPNQIPAQLFIGLTSGERVKKLDGDKYTFYIASDGIAKGSPVLTLMGRLLSGEK